MNVTFRITKKRGGYGFYLKKGSYSFGHSINLYSTKEEATRNAKMIVDLENGVKANPANLFASRTTLKSSHTAKPSNPKFSLAGKLTPSHVPSAKFKNVKYLHPQHPLLMKKSFDPIDPETKTILKAAIKQHGKEAVMKAVRENPAGSDDIQIAKFPDGGFVIHKITGDFTGKISAWFDSTGKLIDAERIQGSKSFPLKKGAPLWNYVSTRYGYLVRKNPASLEKKLLKQARKLKLPLKRAKAYVYGTMNKIKKNPIIGGDGKFMQEAMLKFQQHGMSIPDSHKLTMYLMERIDKKQPGRHALTIQGVRFYIFKK